MQPDPLLQGIDPGSAREMQRMATEASVRESGLALLRKDDPELYQRFLTDLSELDSVYQSLREMLTRTPNHQQLIEAMEENLQMRLLLLERQHDIIQDIKRNKKPRS
jgi:CHASE3 domain sensor protein